MSLGAELYAQMLDDPNSLLLIEDIPYQFLPSLAQIFGDTCALILQQLHYIAKRPFFQHERLITRWEDGLFFVRIEGFMWWDSLEGYLKHLSKRTFERYVTDLKNCNVLVVRDKVGYHKHGDKAKWYAINTVVLLELVRAWKTNFNALLAQRDAERQAISLASRGTDHWRPTQPDSDIERQLSKWQPTCSEDHPHGQPAQDEDASSARAKPRRTARATSRQAPKKKEKKDDPTPPAPEQPAGSHALGGGADTSVSQPLRQIVANVATPEQSVNLSQSQNDKLSQSEGVNLSQSQNDNVSLSIFKNKSSNRISLDIPTRTTGTPLNAASSESATSDVAAQDSNEPLLGSSTTQQRSPSSATDHDTETTPTLFEGWHLIETSRATFGQILHDLTARLVAFVEDGGESLSEELAITLVARWMVARPDVVLPIKTLARILAEEPERAGIDNSIGRGSTMGKRLQSDETELRWLWLTWPAHPESRREWLVMEQARYEDRKEEAKKRGEEVRPPSHTSVFIMRFRQNPALAWVWKQVAQLREAERAEQFQERKAAADVFYATLTRAQRRLFASRLETRLGAFPRGHYSEEDHDRVAVELLHDATLRDELAALVSTDAEDSAPNSTGVSAPAARRDEVEASQETPDLREGPVTVLRRKPLHSQTQAETFANSLWNAYEMGDFLLADLVEFAEPEGKARGLSDEQKTRAFGLVYMEFLNTLVTTYVAGVQSGQIAPEAVGDLCAEQHTWLRTEDGQWVVDQVAKDLTVARQQEQKEAA